MVSTLAPIPAPGALRSSLVVATLLGLVLLASALGASAASAARSLALRQSPGEYEVKAGFLYNFAVFVRWPDSAFESPESPFVFAIVGEDPFGRALDRALVGKSIHDRPIQVRRFARHQDIGECHALFVAESKPEELLRILRRVEDMPVLLIGEQEGFAADGGVVNFYVADKRVCFEINPGQAKQRDLKVSSKLLNLARIVTNKGFE